MEVPCLVAAPAPAAEEAEVVVKDVVPDSDEEAAAPPRATLGSRRHSQNLGVLPDLAQSSKRASGDCVHASQEPPRAKELPAGESMPADLSPEGCHPQDVGGCVSRKEGLEGDLKGGLPWLMLVLPGTLWMKGSGQSGAFAEEGMPEWFSAGHRGSGQPNAEPAPAVADSVEETPAESSAAGAPAEAGGADEVRENVPASEQIPYSEQVPLPMPVLLNRNPGLFPDASEEGAEPSSPDVLPAEQRKARRASLPDIEPVMDSGGRAGKGAFLRACGGGPCAARKLSACMAIRGRWIVA